MQQIPSLAVALLLFVNVATITEAWLPPERCRGGKLWQDLIARHPYLAESPGLPQTWDAPVDHFDPNNTGTFKQRYFLDAQFFKAPENNGTGLVFFMIGGEGTLTGPPSGFVKELGKQYAALLVSLEHRFYGASLPNEDMSTSSYARLLTIDQALADLAAFSDFLQAEHFPETPLRFFTIGGSYPGALAAFYRIAYPGKTVGSLSSSGVVNAILTFSDFDRVVAQAIGGHCADRLRNVTRAFEDALLVPAAACAAKGLFGCDCEMWDADFFYMLADAAAMVDQYGRKAELCSFLLEGLGPAPTALEMLRGFADFTRSYYGPQFGSSCFYDSRCAADLKKATLNERSWRWQKCSELAYFQVAPTERDAEGGSVALRSGQVSLEYHIEQCQRIFSDSVGMPAVKSVNDRFGGAQPTATRVFYSDFSDDPWRAASVQSEEGGPEAEQPFELAVYDGAGHCSDLHEPTAGDHPNLVKLRGRFEAYMTQWLIEETEEVI